MYIWGKLYLFVSFLYDNNPQILLNVFFMLKIMNINVVQGAPTWYKNQWMHHLRQENLMNFFLWTFIKFQFIIFRKEYQWSMEDVRRWNLKKIIFMHTVNFTHKSIIKFCAQFVSCVFFHSKFLNGCIFYKCM